MASVDGEWGICLSFDRGKVWGGRLGETAKDPVDSASVLRRANQHPVNGIDSYWLLSHLRKWVY